MHMYANTKTMNTVMHSNQLLHLSIKEDQINGLNASHSYTQIGGFLSQPTLLSTVRQLSIQCISSVWFEVQNSHAICIERHTKPND